MRRAALAALTAILAISGGPARASEDPRVVVLFVAGLSYERALDVAPSIPAGRIGIGLLTTPGDADPVAVARAEFEKARAIAGTGAVALIDTEDPRDLRETVDDEVLVVVIGAREGDVATMLIARDRPPAGAGDVRGLTSDTTRRPGIVSSADLVPTALRFLGTDVPEGHAGSEIRARGEPSTGLLERYRALEPLRGAAAAMAFGAAMAAFLAGLLLIGVRRVPAWSLRVAAIGGLFGVAIAVALLPAVLLPGPAVLPAALAGAAVLTFAAVRAGGGEPAVPVAVVAGAAMGVVVLDGALGWPGMLMPLIGGNSLEGSRFYGLGNGYGGLLMAGSVLVASRLPPLRGVGLLLAAGLLAGLPGFGANFGTAFTLFAAAGLLFVVGARRDRRLATLAAGAGIWAAGVAAVLVAHRFWAPVATHVSRVVESAERTGLAGIVEVYLRRLTLAVESTAATPAAWLILAALPAWLVVAARRPGAFRPPLERDPAWRVGAIVLAIASLVGFLANDTIGVAAGGFAFLSAALVYPALEMRWKSR